MSSSKSDTITEKKQKKKNKTEPSNNFDSKIQMTNN